MSLVWVSALLSIETCKNSFWLKGKPTIICMIHCLTKAFSQFLQVSASFKSLQNYCKLRSFGKKNLHFKMVYSLYLINLLVALPTKSKTSSLFLTLIQISDPRLIFSSIPGESQNAVTHFVQCVYVSSTSLHMEVPLHIIVGGILWIKHAACYATIQLLLF